MKSYEKYISKENVLKIHQNTIKILENVGVSFENEKALALFKKHGAKIEGNTVFIPEKMLDEALKSVPNHFIMHSTIKDNIDMGGGDRVITPNVSNIYIEDNGTIRKTTNEDNINQFKMGIMSPEINMSSLNQFPDQSKFSIQEKIWGTLAMNLKYSSDYHFTTHVNKREVDKNQIYSLTREAVQFVRNYEGIEDKEKVMTVSVINAMSPLAFNYDPIEEIFAFCEENQPIAVTPCAMPLLTAPSSLMGLMSTTNAEVLAGLVLTQLIKPGIGFIYGNVSGSTDMRTLQLCIGAPEAALICYITAGLADLYNLPFRAGGGLCDAKDMDSQAGAESMMMLYATIDCGADYIMHMIGTMGAFNVVSFEKFILDEEIIAMANRWLRGVDCSENKTCFNDIEKVGPHGVFLRGRTPKNYKEDFYLAKLFNKDDPNNWQNHGGITIKEKAAQIVEKRLSDYEIPSITPEQQKMVDALIPKIYRNNI